MMVMPRMTSRISSRRFTLLKVANAAQIASLLIPLSEARAAAAVAFSALCSPASGILRSDQSFAVAPNLPLRPAIHVGATLRICQSELGSNP